LALVEGGRVVVDPRKPASRLDGWFAGAVEMVLAVPSARRDLFVRSWRRPGALVDFNLLRGATMAPLVGYS